MVSVLYWQTYFVKTCVGRGERASCRGLFKDTPAVSYPSFRAVYHVLLTGRGVSPFCYAFDQVRKGMWKVVKLPNKVVLETKRMRDMELW